MIKFPPKLLNELSKNRQANNVISSLNELLLSSSKNNTRRISDIGASFNDDKSIVDLSFSDIIQFEE